MSPLQRKITQCKASTVFSTQCLTFNQNNKAHQTTRPKENRDNSNKLKGDLVTDIYFTITNVQVSENRKKCGPLQKRTLTYGKIYVDVEEIKSTVTTIRNSIRGYKSKLITVKKKKAQ